MNQSVRRLKDAKSITNCEWPGKILFEEEFNFTKRFAYFLPAGKAGLAIAKVGRRRQIAIRKA